MICVSCWSKRRLAQAVGAEEPVQERNDKLHAQSQFSSQNIYKKHIRSKIQNRAPLSPKIPSPSQNRTPLWHKAHFPAQCWNTSSPKYYSNLKCPKSARFSGVKHIHNSKYSTSDAVRPLYHFLNIGCRRIARRCSEKHISSQNIRNCSLGNIFLSVQCAKNPWEMRSPVTMFKIEGAERIFWRCNVQNCKPLSWACHFYVKMHKPSKQSALFASSNFEEFHKPVLGFIFFWEKNANWASFRLLVMELSDWSLISGKAMAPFVGPSPHMFLV